LRITHIRIKHFRSIEKLDFATGETTAVCGTNSSGKSNLIRALRVALMGNLDSTRLASNVTSWTGPNTQCEIELTFDKPTAELVNQGFHVNTEFLYTTRFKKTGQYTRLINGTTNPTQTTALLESILVVYVPAIRDISVDGLKPFRDSLLLALKKQKGAESLLKLNSTIRKSISARGKTMLASTKTLATEWMKVDRLEVDTTTVFVDSLVALTGIRVRSGTDDFALSKLGTGHQSAVVIKLYRELGTGSGKNVVYLFEEPDNHLHPTSIKVVADELKDCAKSSAGQVFLTTHSPYLLNHVDFKSILPLAISKGKVTEKREIALLRTDRSLRIALSKYGLRPAEALLARRCIVVEGPNDVNVLRALIDLHTSMCPEMQDVMIVPAGGKAAVVDLCDLLSEIGADWKAVLDWDAVEDTNAPILSTGISAPDKATTIAAIQSIQGHLRTTNNKETKAQKILKSMLSELNSPTPKLDFANSVLGKFVGSKSRLSAAGITRLKKAIAAQQPLVINTSLAPLRLFLWKASIEDVVVPPNAELIAENFLVTVGKSFANVPPQQKRQAILAAIKASAHEPDTVTNLVGNIWNAGLYKRREANRVLNFLIN